MLDEPKQMKLPAEPTRPSSNYPLVFAKRRLFCLYNLDGKAIGGIF